MRSLVIVLCNSLLLQRTFNCQAPTTKSLFLRKMSSASAADNEASVIFVTCPDERSAKKIARDVVEKELAACVNIIPTITSIYKWEGKINEDAEVLLMMKTRTTRVNDLSKFVTENHPYSVPEVISLPIQNGNVPYLDWIRKTVPPS